MDSSDEGFRPEGGIPGDDILAGGYVGDEEVVSQEQDDDIQEEDDREGEEQ